MRVRTINLRHQKLSQTSQTSINMVHIIKTPNGYTVADATRDAAGAASTTDVYSEIELRAVLKQFGFTRKAIQDGLLEVNKTGNTTLSLT